MPKAEIDQQFADDCDFLMRQVMDVRTIGEALRLLLIERGVFSDAEYVNAYDRASKLLREAIAAKLEEAGQRALLNTLRIFPGPLQ